MRIHRLLITVAVACLLSACSPKKEDENITAVKAPPVKKVVTKVEPVIPVKVEPPAPKALEVLTFDDAYEVMLMEDAKAFNKTMARIQSGDFKRLGKIRNTLPCVAGIRSVYKFPWGTAKANVKKMYGAMKVKDVTSSADTSVKPHKESCTAYLSQLGISSVYAPRFETLEVVLPLRLSVEITCFYNFINNKLCSIYIKYKYSAADLIEHKLRLKREEEYGKPYVDDLSFASLPRALQKLYKRQKAYKTSFHCCTYQNKDEYLQHTYSHSIPTGEVWIFGEDADKPQNYAKVTYLASKFFLQYSLDWQKSLSK